MDRVHGTHPSPIHMGPEKLQQRGLEIRFPKVRIDE